MAIEPDSRWFLHASGAVRGFKTTNAYMQIAGEGDQFTVTGLEQIAHANVGRYRA
jgi:hypothetical protein